MTKDPEELVDDILFHHIAKERNRLVGKTGVSSLSNIHFSHYTDATAALSIIRNKNIWMRQASEMNDISEINHGIQELFSFFFNTNDNHPCHLFWGVIEPVIKPYIEQKGYSSIHNFFRLYFDNLPKNTFLTCVTEHDTKRDADGRLSMWRGYGAGRGIAFVLNSNPILNHSQVFNTASTPALYYSKQQIAQCFDRIVEETQKNRKLFRNLEPYYLISQIIKSFLSLGISLKHPAFSDEHEWRISLNPHIFPHDDFSPETEIVAGRPQQIFKLPLDNDHGGEYIASFNDLIEQIIIGPASNSSELAQTFIAELKKAGVNDAHKKVIESNIPLRN